MQIILSDEAPVQAVAEAAQPEPETLVDAPGKFLVPLLVLGGIMLATALIGGKLKPQRTLETFTQKKLTFFDDTTSGAEEKTNEIDYDALEGSEMIDAASGDFNMTMKQQEEPEEPKKKSTADRVMERKRKQYEKHKEETEKEPSEPDEIHVEDVTKFKGKEEPEPDHYRIYTAKPKPLEYMEGDIVEYTNPQTKEVFEGMVYTVTIGTDRDRLEVNFPAIANHSGRGSVDDRFSDTTRVYSDQLTKLIERPKGDLDAWVTAWKEKHYQFPMPSSFGLGSEPGVNELPNQGESWGYYKDRMLMKWIGERQHGPLPQREENKIDREVGFKLEREARANFGLPIVPRFPPQKFIKKSIVQVSEQETRSEWKYDEPTPIKITVVKYKKGPFGVMRPQPKPDYIMKQEGESGGKYIVYLDGKEYISSFETMPLHWLQKYVEGKPLYIIPRAST